MKFLSTTGIAYQIEKLLDEAEEHISIITTPFLKFNRVIFSKLEDATQRGVRVRFVYGKTEISKSDFSRLEDLNNLNLYFLKDLHAKCYLNEKEVLITSMNLHDYSIRNNFETQQ